MVGAAPDAGALHDKTTVDPNTDATNPPGAFGVCDVVGTAGAGSGVATGAGADGAGGADGGGGGGGPAMPYTLSVQPNEAAGPPGPAALSTTLSVHWPAAVSPQ